MNNRYLPLIVVLVALGGSPALQSCSTSTTQTTVTQSDPSSPESSSTSTTTTTTTSEPEPDSVVGSTLHAVGTIILFPLRLVGDALGLIL
ncbi:MAG TPA: hypothetical protein VIX59_20850 [Candidatus Binataceae bacterium]